MKKGLRREEVYDDFSRFVHGRAVSEETIHKTVSALIKKYHHSERQEVILTDLASRYTSLLWTLFLPKEIDERKQKISEEFEQFSQMSQEEAELFHKAFLELLRNINKMVSEITVGLLVGFIPLPGGKGNLDEIASMAFEKLPTPPEQRELSSLERYYF